VVSISSGVCVGASDPAISFSLLVVVLVQEKWLRGNVVRMSCAGSVWCWGKWGRGGVVEEEDRRGRRRRGMSDVSRKKEERLSNSFCM
jgi:hypothetical protein